MSKKLQTEGWDSVGCVAESSTIWGMAKMLLIIMTLNIIMPGPLKHLGESFCTQCFVCVDLTIKKVENLEKSNVLSVWAEWSFEFILV